VALFDYDGEKLLSIKRHRANMTILGGRLDILEKPFGISPNPTQRLLLNDMIPLPKVSSDTSPIEYTSIPHSVNVFSGINNAKRFDRKVGWFCIGTGGENPNTPYVINDVKSWETRLYTMVPFRFVPKENDLTQEERASYRLRKLVTLEDEQYVAYYAKAFISGVIKSTKSEADYVPQIEDSEPYIGDGTNHPMKGYNSQTFIEFELEVASNEFKEYYRATHNGSLQLARLSELGLITGHDAINTLDGDRVELANAELFAKLTHKHVVA
jgi:hypothetical protein